MLKIALAKLLTVKAAAIATVAVGGGVAVAATPVSYTHLTLPTIYSV